MSETKAPQSTGTPDAPPTGGRSLWSRTSFVLSVALVLALVVAALWLVLDKPDRSGPAGPHAAAPVPHQVADGCGPGGSSQTPPAVAPATSWQLVGSMAAPTSKAAGPVTLDQGIGLCYSADPVGALFAAANFTAAASSPDLRAPALEKLAAPGSGRDAALAATQGNPGPANVGIQVAGYQFTSYERFTTGQLVATVSLALSTQGRLLALPLQLVFTDGDWKVVIPVTGRPFDGMAVIPSLAGFVPWQGA
jgi:hypothetical protein